tara:strand:- start:11297 stop:13324 length:2028 start_codon:yes stop_codon:yes gene_type:complete
MSGLTDEQLFGTPVTPQAPPISALGTPVAPKVAPVSTGMTDAELFGPETVEQQEDPRSYLEQASAFISDMSVDSVLKHLKKHGELPGGLGGAAVGALIGFLSPMPGGTLIGSIIGGGIGSGGGSATSDVLMSKKKGLEALDDISYVDALTEAGLSVGIDVATLGLGRYVGKPIWNAIKNRISNGEASQVVKELAETGGLGAADVGEQQARYQSQALLEGTGETLTKFSLGLTDSLGATLENLGRHSIGGAGRFENAQKRIIGVVSERLQEFSNITSLPSNSFGKMFTTALDQGKEAVKNAYKANQDMVFKQMGKEAIDYRAAKKAIFGWEKAGITKTTNGISKLTPNELNMIDALRPLIEKRGSPRELLDLDNKLQEVVEAAKKAASTGTEVGRIKLFQKRVKNGITTTLKEEVSPNAAKSFSRMNRDYRRGLTSLFPEINKNMVKKLDAGAWTRIGDTLAGGGDPESIKAAVGSLKTAYRRMSPIARKEAGLPSLEVMERHLASGYIVNKLGSLTKEAMDPRKFMKEAINLQDSTYAASAREALGVKKFNSYKKLVNLMSHAHDTPKAGMFSLVQRAKEASAVSSVASAITRGSAQLAISATGKVAGLFLLPYVFSRVATNPKNVNKMIAINAMGEGKELVKTKVAASIINDIVAEMVKEGMSEKEIEAKFRGD